MSLRKSALAGASAIALSAGLAYSAQATTILPVTNLQFNQFDTGSSFTTPTTACGTGGGSALCTPKDLFTEVKPTNWSIGTTTGLIDNLIYVGQQGSEGTKGPRTGANVYPVYTTPGFTNLFPGQNVNFFQADGNPQFESTITQDIPGLKAGTTYTLEFQQAAGQQVGFSGATTEQWLVYLGVGGIGVSCPTSGLCTVTGTADNQFDASTLMNTPSMMNHDWETANLSFTPTASDFLSNGDAVLTFLAWGNNGSDINLPPTVFLEGVNITPPMGTPEPATLSLLGVGLLGLGGIAWRRRAKRNAAT
jgi:PEP-CTERM motif